MERNECANVLQVGFIKLRPGTLVLALHNYHVTKPGSREMLTYSCTVDEHTHAQKNEKGKNVIQYTNIFLHIPHPQLRFKRSISLLSDELFKTK